MHYWGDGFKYFSEVCQAAEEIETFCRKWGRIGVLQSKEKYGTVRVYCQFGWVQLNELVYPGYHYLQSPKWLMGLYLPKFISNLGFIWQKFIYTQAYKRALKRYPMIIEEILHCPDYPEFLKHLYKEGLNRN
jgi:hypothetical protein